MIQIQTHNNQTWFDISIYFYGTSDHAFYLANHNGESVTESIIPGSIIEIPDFNKNGIVLASLKNTPATDITKENNDSIESLGIGIMIIETNFIVG